MLCTYVRGTCLKQVGSSMCPTLELGAGEGHNHFFIEWKHLVFWAGKIFYTATPPTFPNLPIVALIGL